VYRGACGLARQARLSERDPAVRTLVSPSNMCTKWVQLNYGSTECPQRAAHLGRAGNRAGADGAGGALLRSHSGAARRGACAASAGARGGVRVQHLFRRGAPARVPRYLRRSNGSIVNGGHDQNHYGRLDSITDRPP